MGVCVLVLGDSGSGKSSSLRNFDVDEIGIFNVMGKPLPFRKRLLMADHSRYENIITSLRNNTMRTYAVDDAGYLMSLENFSRARETGYAKFTDMAMRFEQLIEAATQTDRDTVVYLFMHIERDDQGRGKPKTIGKMLDNQFNIAGACPIVIESTIQDGKHVFVTKGDGHNGAKAPMGLLPDMLDPDLAAGDDAIREYWKMAPRYADAPKGGDGHAA